MITLRTLEDYLRENDAPADGLFDCACGVVGQPAFAFVERRPGEWMCSNCYLESLPAPAVISPMNPWESDAAAQVRVERTQLQDRWRWAVMPDSPLTAEAQARCMLFLKSLNRLTIAFPTPAAIVWPAEPVLVGDDYQP